MPCDVLTITHLECRGSDQFATASEDVRRNRERAHKPRRTRLRRALQQLALTSKETPRVLDFAICTCKQRPLSSHHVAQLPFAAQKSRNITARSFRRHVASVRLTVSWHADLSPSRFPRPPKAMLPLNPVEALVFTAVTDSSLRLTRITAAKSDAKVFAYHHRALRGTLSPKLSCNLLSSKRLLLFYTSTRPHNTSSISRAAPKEMPTSHGRSNSLARSFGREMPMPFWKYSPLNRLLLCATAEIARRATLAKSSSQPKNRCEGKPRDKKFCCFRWAFQRGCGSGACYKRESPPIPT